MMQIYDTKLMSLFPPTVLLLLWKMENMWVKSVLLAIFLEVGDFVSSKCHVCKADCCFLG